MENSSQDRPVQDNQVAQPMKGRLGAIDPGPRNVLLDRQNPSMLIPPSIDYGTIPNLKFSFQSKCNECVA
jgi:oxalate decarboxylase